MLLSCPLCQKDLKFIINETIPSSTYVVGLCCICGVYIRSSKTEDADSALAEVCGVLEDINNILEVQQ